MAAAWKAGGQLRLGAVDLDRHGCAGPCCSGHNARAPGAPVGSLVATASGSGVAVLVVPAARTWGPPTANLLPLERCCAANAKSMPIRSGPAGLFTALDGDDPRSWAVPLSVFLLGTCWKLER